MKMKKMLSWMLSLILVIAMAVTTAACGNNAGTNESGSSAAESNQDSSKEDPSGTINGSTEIGSTEIGSSEPASSEPASSEPGTTGDSSSENGSSSQKPSGSEGSENGSSSQKPSTDPSAKPSEPSSSDNNPGTVEDPSTEPVEGTKEAPITGAPEESGDGYVIKTQEIAPGKSLFYHMYRIGNKRLVVEDKDIRIVYDGKTYKPASGKLKMTMEDIQADKAVLFEIKNNGKTAKSFTIKIENIEGTSDAPETIKAVDGKNHSLSFKGEDEHDWYYIYTAEKAGDLLFTVAEATSNARINIEVTVITGANTDSPISVQHSTYENFLETGNWDTTLKITVKKGDVVQIHIASTEDSKTWEFPDTDVKWNVKYN